jgi:hypothetical protein
VFTGSAPQEGIYQFGVEWHKKPSLWVILSGPALGGRLHWLYYVCLQSVFHLCWMLATFDICRFGRFHSVTHQHDDSERVLIILLLSPMYMANPIFMAPVGILTSKKYTRLRS